MSKGILAKDLIFIHWKSKVRRERSWEGEPCTSSLKLCVMHPFLTMQTPSGWGPRRTEITQLGPSKGSPGSSEASFPQQLPGGAWHRCPLLKTEPWCSLFRRPATPESSTAALLSDSVRCHRLQKESNVMDYFSFPFSVELSPQYCVLEYCISHG